VKRPTSVARVVRSGAHFAQVQRSKKRRKGVAARAAMVEFYVSFAQIQWLTLQVAPDVKYPRDLIVADKRRFGYSKHP
jgi:hypothetical protein